MGLAALLAACAGVRWKASREYDAAVQNYRASAHSEAVLAAKNVSVAFDQIYQNLRTIGLLASVRRIDRHGDTLSADARQSVQQLYNNLAKNVDVSEVYVVPV
jgi:hypothetical protein